MISIYNIKPKFQNLLRPVLESLHRKNISANQITIASIILSFVIGTLFWFADVNTYFFLALPLGLLVRMALNALDGMMARTYNQQTKTGELLNEVGDILSDVFIYFPLLKHETDHTYLVVVFILLGIINEFCGIMGKVIKGDRRYDGPMGKSDRAFVIGLYGLLGAFSVTMSGFIDIILIIVIILLIISTYTRIRKSLI